MASGIIEKLSNDSANGYCKFPDGTLIQWGSFVVNETGSLAQVASSGIYSGVTSPTSFPLPFINGDYIVTGAARYATGYSTAIGFLAYTASTWRCALYDFYQRPMNDGNFVVKWQAIGRWK